MRNDLDLAVGLLADLDHVAEVAGAALDLDAVVEELLESGGVEDLVVDGLGAVDDELYEGGDVSTASNFLFSGCACRRILSHTFLVILPALPLGVLPVEAFYMRTKYQ